MGIGIFIDHVREDTPIVSATTSSEMAEIATFEEIPTLSKIEALPTETVQDISDTAKITTHTTRAATTTTTYSYAATSIPTYYVTVHASQIQSQNLSNTDIYKTGKLIYGHDSDHLLASAKSLQIGSTFTVVENGITSTYQVSDFRIFYKSSIYDLELCTSGYDNCAGGTYHTDFFQTSSTFRGQNYDVALFTCDGPNVSGTHRRVVFANKI